MHKRNKSLAYEMMRQAKLAGATIAKFQFGWPKDDMTRYIDDWAQDIVEWSHDIGIDWMASIWSQDGLSVARSVGAQKYKIAHQIALDPQQVPLVTNIIASGYPVYISGALHSAPHVYPIYVHADTYPTYEPHMPKHFTDYYGYSSHAHGIGDALVAVARGAMYIEKHFTLDKTDPHVRDASFSLSPDEFADMVKYGNEVSRAAGPRRTYLRLDDPKVIVDVGAYLGYTIEAWRRWYPEAVIYAFEPLFYDKIKKLEGPTTHIFPQAASSEIKTIIAEFRKEHRRVEAVTLDSVIKEPVDFLKIDVEGHEAHVLEGALRILKEDRPVVQIEYFMTPTVIDAFFDSIDYHLLTQIHPDRIYVPNEHPSD
jgi:hypothetical protein